MSGIKEELHLTHGSDARSLCEELDYVDMLALSGLFRQWALYEKRFTPEQRTALIAWSADLEDWRDGPAKGGVPPTKVSVNPAGSALTETILRELAGITMTVPRIPKAA